MTDKDCIFCKIAGGEIPSITAYEDEEFRVIFDISPASKGHMLIIPKNHFANLFEMDDETAGKVMVLAKKIATAVKQCLGCDGINIVQNNGLAAGQTVFHYHLHIIPRYEGDKPMVCWKAGEIDKPAMEELANQLRSLL